MVGQQIDGERAPRQPLSRSTVVIDDSEIQRVAVVDADHRLLGVISDRALLAAFAGHRAELWDYLLQRLPMAEIGRRHQAMAAYARAKTAADAMQTELVTVREDALLEEAIRLMAQHQLKRLPVVGEGGVFRGMISRDAVTPCRCRTGQHRTRCRGRLRERPIDRYDHPPNATPQDGADRMTPRWPA
jgi:CBS domain-containing protein